MKILIYVFLVILFVLITGIIKKVGSIVLLQNKEITSVESSWFFLYVLFCIIFITNEDIGQWLLLGFIIICLLIQYIDHWKITLFCVDQDKIDKYNKKYSNTYHILKFSENKAFPDLYHLFLSTNLVIVFILLLVYSLM